MKIFISAIVWMVAAAAGPLSANEPLSVFINQTSTKPGQTLKVQLPLKYHVPPSLTWRNTTHRFNRTFDNHWRVLIPIPVDQQAGEESFYITPNTLVPGILFEGLMTFQIEPGGFGAESLAFSKSKSELLNETKEEEESRLIRELIAASLANREQLWRGLFLAPVPGDVRSPFGLTRRRMGQAKVDFHRGVDLAAKEGEPVLAPNAGVVLLAKAFAIHGNTVLVNHGQGVNTIYLHLSVMEVKEGDLVKTSQVIGKAGSTGLATGPHLHWGLYVEGQPVDPLQWLQQEF